MSDVAFPGIPGDHFPSVFVASEPLSKEVQALAFIEVVSKLRSHENKTVSHQASLTEQKLTAQS